MCRYVQGDCNADVDIVQDIWIADVESYTADNVLNSDYIANNQKLFQVNHNADSQSIKEVVMLTFTLPMLKDNLIC